MDIYLFNYQQLINKKIHFGKIFFRVGIYTQTQNSLTRIQIHTKSINKLIYPNIFYYLHKKTLISNALQIRLMKKNNSFCTNSSFEGDAYCTKRIQIRQTLTTLYNKQNQELELDHL